VEEIDKTYPTVPLQDEHSDCFFCQFHDHCYGTTQDRNQGEEY
jgi:hypothetical protein